MPEDKPKLKLIMLEGPDKAGKSTMYQMYRRATLYQPLVIDRFLASNYVYDIFYNRGSRLDIYLEEEANLQTMFDCYLVYLTASEPILRGRINELETGIDREKAIFNFKIIDDLYKDYFFNKTRFGKKLVLETDKLTRLEVLEAMLNFTGEVRR